ncbi:MAG: CHRD domain-containing protein [Candidatus Nitrosopolaris sp.]
MSNFHPKITIACLVASVIAAVSTIPILSYAQQQTNFVATLTGKNVVPPVDTTATGTAKFHVNPNGTLSYEIDVNNINQVVGVPIRLKDGTDLTELLNLYATVNQKSFTQSLGAVNGQLVSGVLTANKLDGPLFGRNITDLVSFFTNKSAYVIVRTTQHQQGEIQGQILPGGMNAAIIGVNKTAGMNATTGVNKTAGMNATTGAGMICHYLAQSKALLCMPR